MSLAKSHPYIAPSSLFLPVPPRGVVFETARLAFREPAGSDQAIMDRIFCDADTMQFIGDPSTPEQSKSILSAWQSGWDDGVSMCGIIDDRASRQSIGTASLHRSCIPGFDGVEISYMLTREHRGLGYAREMARALVDYGFSVLGLTRVLIETNPENRRSNDLAKDLGFSLAAELRYVNKYWPKFERHNIWVKERSRVSSDAVQ